MEICINYGGHEHHHVVPVMEFALRPGFGGGPGPINYPQFLHDAVMVASLYEAAQKVADHNVRRALHEGCVNAVKAMQEHAGPDVRILELENTAGGPPTGGGAHGPGRRD